MHNREDLNQKYKKKVKVIRTAAVRRVHPVLDAISCSTGVLKVKLKEKKKGSKIDQQLCFKLETTQTKKKNKK